MGLSLGVYINSQIQIGGSVLRVLRMPRPPLIVVRLDNGDDILVSDRERTEIMPGVFLSVGKIKKGFTNRLLIEAPKSVPITRLVV